MARKRIEFWLDEKKPNERWLLDNIPMLKSKWVFSRCMREGLELLIHFREWSIKAADVYELIIDLRAGNLDKLLSMFPHLKSKLVGNGAGDNELTKEVRHLQDLMLSISKGNGYNMLSLASAQNTDGPKALNIPSLAMPIFEEDDEPTVLIRASTSTDSSMNFVTALRNMQ